MYPKRSLALLALMCGLIWAAPATAGHGHRAQGHPDLEAGGEGDVPSRIAKRLARAERALGRAEDKVDDEDATGAAKTLRSVRKNLGAALKSARRRVTSGNEYGPDSIGAVFDTQHEVIETTSGLFDGADGEIVDSISDALNAGIEGRDSGIAAIAALSEDDRADYDWVLESVLDDVTSEIEAIDEALADDTLTDEGRAALEQAKTKLEATKTTVEALVPDAEAGDVADEDGRDCPRGERGGRRGGREGAEV